MFKKVLLVTGASSDMGICLLEQIGIQYDEVIVQYRNMNDDLRKCLNHISCDVTEIKADLTKAEDVKNMMAKLQSCDVPMHFVHFPAAAIKNCQFDKINWDKFQNQIEISLKSFIIISQYLLPRMVENNYGKIVIMLSYVTDIIPPRYCSDYVMTKYALLGLMKALAVEYAEKGITVNGISPAYVETKFISKQPSFLVRMNAEYSPLGRNLVPLDIIPTVEFLLSDYAECINGQNLIISGGGRWFFEHGKV